ncbi:Selenoprotein K [Trichinella pseudospiralis]|uniref:Selenoprotein K n=1 Tax=Trichinella pseudospiralis TaxID=6337 RepID=A0A0V1EKL0_TRIPS|nr:Selenoprotein K [Trichinella pseudospiralis]
MVYITRDGEIRQSKGLIPWFRDSIRAIFMAIYFFFLTLVNLSFQPDVSRDRKASSGNRYSGWDGKPHGPGGPPRRRFGGLQRNDAPACPPLGGGS